MTKNKKAEISTFQLVGIIILIVGFVILLVFLNRMKLQENIAQEVCHTSVILKSTAIAVENELKPIVPLKCTSQILCLTKDGTCEKMISPKIVKVSKKEEIYYALAESMATCWWMFGEGQIDYIGKEIFANKNYCSLCNQIAFDDSIKKIEPSLENGYMDRLDFFEYLAKNKVEGKDITYWDYMYTKGEHVEEETKLTREETNALINVYLDQEMKTPTSLKGSEFFVKTFCEAGISEFKSENCEVNSNTAFAENILNIFNANPESFTRINLNALQPGDIVFTTKDCETTNLNPFPMGVVKEKGVAKEGYFSYSVYLREWYKSEIKTLNTTPLPGNSQEYIYQAFRYTKGLTSSSINGKYTPMSLTSASNYVDNLGGRNGNTLYSQDAGFIFSLIADNILTNEECKELIKPGSRFENIIWVKGKLDAKIKAIQAGETANQKIIDLLAINSSVAYQKLVSNQPYSFGTCVGYGDIPKGLLILLNDAGISGLIDSRTSHCDANMITFWNVIKNKFTRVSLSDLKPGDIVFIRKDKTETKSYIESCSKDIGYFKVGIVISTNKETSKVNVLFGESKDLIKTASFNFPDNKINKEGHLYRAYRYSEKLTPNSINLIKYAPEFNVDTAKKEVIKFEDSTSSQYKLFVSSLIFDGVLGEEECKQLTVNLQNPAWIKQQLESKTVYSSNPDYQFKPINLSRNHYITMGITSKLSPLGQAVIGAAEGLVGTGLVIASVALSGGATLPVIILALSVGAKATIAAGALNYYLAPAIEGDSGQIFIRPTLIESSDDFEYLNCQDVTTLG